FVINDEMKWIDELNKEKIIYENSTNERIENRKKYNKMYKKFEKDYLKKEAKSLFKDVMNYSERYEDQKAQVLVENIDEILKDDVKKDKKMIEDELLKMIKMRRGKLREHNSGKLDDKLNNILIKPNEYERIGR
ncbi:hypothetical protein, partial [Streptobacillus felis]